MHYTTDLLRHTRRLIGRNIRAYRQRRRMTLARLSRQCGISADMIDRYELGCNEITLHELLRIGCALDCTMHDMVTE